MEIRQATLTVRGLFALPAARACKGDGRGYRRIRCGCGSGSGGGAQAARLSRHRRQAAFVHAGRPSPKKPSKRLEKGGGGCPGRKAGASAPFLLSSPGLQPFNATEPFRTPWWPTEPNARLTSQVRAEEQIFQAPPGQCLEQCSHHSGLNYRRSASQLFAQT